MRYVYLLSNPKGSVACATFRQEIYAIGFLHRQHAELMLPYPNLIAIMRKRHFDMASGKLDLYMIKNEKQEPSETLEVTLAPYEDFMAYPYEKCLGVVAVESMARESPQEFSFICTLHDKSCSPDTYRNYLKM